MFDHARSSMLGDALATTGKASPSLAVSAATIFGFGLQEWVFIATLVLNVTLFLHLVWKWHREWRADRPARAGADGEA